MLSLGYLDDLSQLKSRLEEIFRDRKIYEAYRPNTTEVEKSVIIKEIDSMKIGDFLNLVEALEDAGANPIQADERNLSDTIAPAAPTLFSKQP
jgi:hypothetical protein